MARLFEQLSHGDQREDSSAQGSRSPAQVAIHGAQRKQGEGLHEADDDAECS
jgi:hypothetical protein